MAAEYASEEWQAYPSDAWSPYPSDIWSPRVASLPESTAKIAAGAELELPPPAEAATQPTTPQFWTNYYQDILWALLNSNEFILNH